MSGLTQNLAGTAQDVTWTYTRNQAGEIASHSWSNDAYQWSGLPNGTRTYSANGLNQYTQAAGATLSYDANANLTGDGTWTYTDDLDNRLRSAAKTGLSATLAYDAEGRLRQTAIAGTTTSLAYDGTDLIAEYNSASTLLVPLRPRPRGRRAPGRLRGQRNHQQDLALRRSSRQHRRSGQQRRHQHRDRSLTAPSWSPTLPPVSAFAILASR